MDVKKKRVNKCMKFTDYYKDPEYKANHLAYCLEKIPCDVCGTEIARNYKSRHIRSKKHQTNLQVQQLLGLKKKK